MRRPTGALRRAGLTGAGSLLAVLALAGCSADTESAAPATESPSVCEDLDAASSSLRALVDTNIAQEGTDTLKERYATLESDVRTLLDSGQSELAPTRAAVEDSIADLAAVLAGLGEGATAAELAQIKPAILAVRTAMQDLVTALDDTC